MSAHEKLRARINEAQDTIPRIYRHAAGMWPLLYAPTSRQPEADVKKRGKPTGSPMLTADRHLAPAWHNITVHIAQAHRSLAELNPDQCWRPERVIGYPCLADVLNDQATSKRVARTVALEELAGALEALTSILGHVDEAAHLLTAPGRKAAHGACDEVAAAYQGVPDHLRRPPRQPRQQHTRACVNSINGCRNTAREGGKQCGTCANYRTRHGRDRVV